MKKLIAILLALTTTMTLGIPAFATGESSTPSDAQTENPAITEEEILDILQSEEVKVNGIIRTVIFTGIFSFTLR